MSRQNQNDFKDLISKMNNLQSRLKDFIKSDPVKKELPRPIQFEEKFPTYLSQFYADKIEEDPDNYDSGEECDEEPEAIEMTTAKAGYFIKKINYIFEQGFYRLVSLTSDHLENYPQVLKSFTARFLMTSPFDITLTETQRIIAFFEEILFCFNSILPAERLKILNKIFSEILCLSKEEIHDALEIISLHLSYRSVTFRFLNRERSKLCQEPTPPARKIVKKTKTKSTSESKEIKTVETKDSDYYNKILQLTYDHYQQSIQSISKDTPTIFYVLKAELFDFFALNILPKSIMESFTGDNFIESRKNFLQILPQKTAILLKILRIIPVYDQAYSFLNKAIASFTEVRDEAKTVQSDDLQKKMINLEETLDFSADIGKGLILPPTANPLVSGIVKRVLNFNQTLTIAVITALADTNFKLPVLNSAAMNILVKINQLVSIIVSMLIKNKGLDERAETIQMIATATEAYDANPDELPKKHENLASAIQKYKDLLMADALSKGIAIITFSSPKIGSAQDEKDKSVTAVASNRSKTPAPTSKASGCSSPKILFKAKTKVSDACRQQCIQYLRGGHSFYKEYARKKSVYLTAVPSISPTPKS